MAEGHVLRLRLDGSPDLELCRSLANLYNVHLEFTLFYGSLEMVVFMRKKKKNWGRTMTRSPT